MTVLLAAGVAAEQFVLPAIGAGGLLHPARRTTPAGPPAGCSDADFAGEGIALRGWRCRSGSARRGTLIYLHGIADNRASATGVIVRFTSRGFDVVAYDSRAHGASGGDACTYGVFEKADLARVIDTVDSGQPLVLMGTSLGAAVALQEAAMDRRVTAVVAAETFADLRTVVTERAPAVFTSAAIGKAFQLARTTGHLDVDAVSPVAAAARITAPVLLIHGDADRDTVPEHSRRVFAALAGPKQLVLVPGAHHNESLRAATVWATIDRWLDAVLADSTPG